MISIYDNIWKLAQENPAAKSLVFEDKQLTRIQFCNLANGLANELAKLGVNKGPISINAPAQLAAIATAGCLQLGIASMKYSQAQAELAGFVITAEPLAINTPQLILDEQALTRFVSAQAMPVEKGFESLDSICRIVFTSGTTGEPKPVGISVRRAMLESKDRNKKITSRGNELCHIDQGTLVSFAGVLACLRFGHVLFIEDSPNLDMDFIQSNEIAVYRSTPEKLSALSGLSPALPESLRWVDSIGGFLPTHVSQDLSVNRGLILTVRYGTTETGAVSARVGHNEDWQNLGKPVEEDLVSIVDDEDKTLPAGRQGKLKLIKRKSFMSSNEDRFFYPGDEGYIDEQGNLVVLGRTDEFINLPGIRLNLVQLENELRVHFPNVEMAAVFNQESTEIILAIQAEFELSIPLIEKHLKMDRPNLQFTTQMTDSLPKNQMGKIQRQKLLQQLRPSTNL